MERGIITPRTKAWKELDCKVVSMWWRLGHADVRRHRRPFPFFLRVDGKQHVMVETVPAVIAVLAEGEVNLGAFRKQERGIVLREWHRTILHDLVLAEELNFRQRIHEFGFHANDLKLVGSDPRAP